MKENAERVVPSLPAALSTILGGKVGERSRKGGGSPHLR